jgi:hypothetical protein
MRLGADRLRDLIRTNVDGGALLTCHQTLSYGEHPEVGQAACRGFFDAYGHQTAAGRFAVLVMGGFDEIPPPAPLEEVTPMADTARSCRYGAPPWVATGHPDTTMAYRKLSDGRWYVLDVIQDQSPLTPVEVAELGLEADPRG